VIDSDERSEHPTTVMFGSGASALAIRDLADRYQTQSLMLEDPASPVGIVEIDEMACTGCQTCVGACPTQALSTKQLDNETIITFDSSRCVACGECVSVCREIEAGAITMRPGTDLNLLSRGRRSLYRGTDALCERCGSAIAPRAMLDRIAELLGEDFSAEHVGRLCVNCRGT
jgi:ferredoxin